MRSLILLTLAGLALLPRLALAEDDEQGSDVAYGAEVDMASRYLWRGLALSDAPVIQPSAHVSYGGATLTLWSSMFTAAAPDSRFRLGEVDLIVEYEASWGPLTITPSVVAYMYPDEADTAEVGLAVKLDLGVIALQTHQALDVVDNRDGWYADVGVTRSQALGPAWTLEGTAAVAWCSARFVRYYMDGAMDGGHFGAVTVDAALEWAASETVSLKLHGSYSRMLDDEIHRALGGARNLFAAGLSVGVER